LLSVLPQQSIGVAASASPSPRRAALRALTTGRVVVIADGDMLAARCLGTAVHHDAEIRHGRPGASALWVDNGGSRDSRWACQRLWSAVTCALGSAAFPSTVSLETGEDAAFAEESDQA
jgi:hypothetical protein